MQNEVTLSIVMPVFNHPEELKTMLDSILANIYQDWELLTVDDGSEQETLSLLEQYAKKDGRIHVIRRGRLPKGAQTCRNIGLEQAEGEYIVFFDSDDFVAPHCLEQRVREIKAHPDLDFMVFRNGIYRDNQFHIEPDRDDYGYPVWEDDIAAFCSRTLPFVVWNNIYRREALIRNGIRWDTNLLSLQDLDFNMQTLLCDMRYEYAPCPPDYGYRTVHMDKSISGKIHSKAHQQSHIYALNKLYSMTTERWKDRYDHNLYQGALFMLSILTRTEYDRTVTGEISRIVKTYSRNYGRYIRIKTCLMALLSKVLPQEITRKVVLASYLRKHYGKLRRKVAKIHGLQQPS